MQALIQKVQDPVFLMNLLNSEGGKKLLNLAGDFLKILLRNQKMIKMKTNISLY